MKSICKKQQMTISAVCLLAFLGMCSAFREIPYFTSRLRTLRMTDCTLTNELVNNCGPQNEAEKLDCDGLFTTFANNKQFVSEYWQKKPYHCGAPLHTLVRAFTMQDVEEAVETDFLEAGRGMYKDGSGGWKMAPVSKPTGNSFQEAKLKFNEVDQVIKTKSGTIVFNSAGGFIPKLAGVCLQCTNAFDLPCALNMYLTAAGQEISAPPHTDKQDVFVLQTQVHPVMNSYRRPYLIFYNVNDLGSEALEGF